MAIDISQYPAKLKRGLESARGQEFPLVGLTVQDTFSHAGSRNAYNGSKLSLVLNIGGHNVTVAARCGLKGNSRDIVHGLTLTDEQNAAVDTFWASELWLAYAERCPNKATVCIGYHENESKATLFVSLTTARGVEAVLEMTASAPDTAVLAYTLANGAGYHVPEKVFSSLMEAIIKSRDDKAAGKKAA